jgi:hypothetical protein
LVSNQIAGLRQYSIRAAQKLFKPNALQEELILMMEEMGYTRDIIERLIEKHNVTDVGEAIDLAARHKFLPQNHNQGSQICYICENIPALT